MIYYPRDNVESFVFIDKPVLLKYAIIDEKR